MAKAVVAAGFWYDPGQDIIFSRLDAWQRNFGYAYAYDCAAPATISAIIVCEPLFFSHGGKDWMIELWKGQYGLESGGEIGVYNADIGRSPKRDLLDSTIGQRPHDPDPAHNRFFDSVSDKELLKMSFALMRDGTPLLSRGPEMHWWLTGFKPGELSTPDQLTMDVCITLTDVGMCEAFLLALKEAGYENCHADSGLVSFTFDRPKSRQPRLESGCDAFVDAAQKTNTELVRLYRALELSSNDPNQEIPSDAAEKLVDYFRSHRPEHLAEQVAKLLKTAGCGAAEVLRILRAVGFPKGGQSP